MIKSSMMSSWHHNNIVINNIFMNNRHNICAVTCCKSLVWSTGLMSMESKLRLYFPSCLWEYMCIVDMSSIYKHGYHKYICSIKLWIYVELNHFSNSGYRLDQCYKLGNKCWGYYVSHIFNVRSDKCHSLPSSNIYLASCTSFLRLQPFQFVL